MGFIIFAVGCGRVISHILHKPGKHTWKQEYFKINNRTGGALRKAAPINDRRNNNDSRRNNYRRSNIDRRDNNDRRDNKDRRGNGEEATAADVAAIMR